MKYLKNILFLVITVALSNIAVANCPANSNSVQQQAKSENPDQPKVPETPPNPSKKDSREVVKTPSRDTTTTTPKPNTPKQP